MATVAPEYEVLSQVRQNVWDPQRQQTQDAWLIEVRWVASGAHFTVTVPATAYTAPNVDAAIRAVGYETDAVAALGKAPATPPPPAKG